MTELLHQAIEGPLEESPEWLECRKWEPGRVPRIGASRAAAACNQSTYATSLDVFLDARGRERVCDEAAIKRMRRGRKMQSIIIEEAGLEMNALATENNRMWIHPQFPFCVATPDAFVAVKPTAVMEVKAPSTHMFSRAPEDYQYGDDGTDLVPNDTLFQVQQQMAVMGMYECYVAAMFGVNTLRIYRIQRNEDLIDAIIDAEKELAERIAANDPPDPEWTHPNTRKLIADLKGYQPNIVVHLNEEHLGMWLERKRISEEIVSLELRKDELTNRLLWAFEGAEIGRFPRGEKELRRCIVKDSFWTPKDVEDVTKKVGTVQRRGHERLLERKTQ